MENQPNPANEPVWTFRGYDAPCRIQHRDGALLSRRDSARQHLAQSPGHDDELGNPHRERSDHICIE